LSQVQLQPFGIQKKEKTNITKEMNGILKTRDYAQQNTVPKMEV
jgi:hypothetical protein